MYDDAFSRMPGAAPVRVMDCNVSCFHLYVVRNSRRDDLADHLRSKGIVTGVHYPVPLHLQKCYEKLGFGQGAFPNSEENCSRVLSLPMFPELTTNQIARVVKEVNAFVEKR